MASPGPHPEPPGGLIDQGGTVAPCVPEHGCSSVRGRELLLRLLPCLLLALLAWGPSVPRGGFALDDREAISGNPVVEGSLPLREAFVRDYWHHHGDAGHWRPVAILSLALDHRLHGLDSRGYHLSSLLLHLFTVGLAGCVLAWLGASRTSYLALAVFAVHPAAADVVAWISGRTSSLSTVGGMVALGAVLRLRQPLLLFWLTLLGCLFALGSKEDGGLFALFCLALAWTRRREGRWPVTGGVLFALLAGAALRWQALGEVLPSAPHAPLASAPLDQRLVAGGSSLAEALRLAVAPLPHSPQPPADLGAGGPWIAAAAWLLWLVTFTWGAALARRGRESALTGASLAAACLSYLPHMQLVPSGELFAPRFLYLPLLLLLPALGEALARLPRSRLLVGLSLPLLVAGAWQQAAIYGSRSAYWERVAEHDPDDARALHALGNAALEQGDRDGAREAFERARQLRPLYSRPWVGLAGIALAEGRTDEAVELLEEAVQRGPENPKAWGNLGVALLRLERWGDARVAYREAARLSPGSPALWRGLGRSCLQLGRSAEGLEALQRALALDPRDRTARALLEAAGSAAEDDG